MATVYRTRPPKGMDHFYVSLPSNSSKKYYGVQSMSNFRTKLAREINLDVNQWEVGLSNIIYPISWHNLINATFKVKTLNYNDEWKWIDGKITDNRYEDVPQLIAEFEQQLEEVLGADQNKIRFRYLPTRHVKIYITNDSALQLSQNLAEVLGFGETCNENNNDEYLRFRPVTKLMYTIGHDEICDVQGSIIKSPFVADVHRNRRTLFVHCDIIKSQLVGDLYIPLLRTIAIQGRTDEVVSVSFPNIHYMGIERSTFQVIEVHITDEIGRNIPFQQGRVIVELHFKRK